MRDMYVKVGSAVTYCCREVWYKGRLRCGKERKSLGTVLLSAFRGKSGRNRVTGVNVRRACENCIVFYRKLSHKHAQDLRLSVGEWVTFRLRAAHVLAVKSYSENERRW